MKIAIIGAGNVGTSLGSGWTKSGHTISYGVRNPQDAKFSELRTLLPEAVITTNAAAAQDAEVIVLCTPWGGTEAAVRDCGSLAGKIVIDATNPLKADITGLSCGFDTSAGEQVAQWAVGAQVFKAMNQVGASQMDHPVFKGPSKPVMFVAGEGDRKGKVLQLVAELGFESIDVGGLEYARLLEPLAMLWIHLAVFKGQGSDFAFGLLRK
ncbi:MAG: NAD(P)-binding domain-containing protein [Verrucomicrobia bacterium]|nr:NAD(P)-binding domain-containing protein [Verrucomicrobiota bacterium]